MRLFTRSENDCSSNHSMKNFDPLPGFSYLLIRHREVIRPMNHRKIWKITMCHLQEILLIRKKKRKLVYIKINYHPILLKRIF
jgi:hypothetical protein